METFLVLKIDMSSRLKTISFGNVINAPPVRNDNTKL